LRLRPLCKTPSYHSRIPSTIRVSNSKATYQAAPDSLMKGLNRFPEIVSLEGKEGGGVWLATRAASGKPYGRPDVKLSITAPDTGVPLIFPSYRPLRFYPCAGMASLPRASCLYILQTLDNTSLLHPRGQLKYCGIVC
jgi:hypothetical protein